MMLTTVMPVFTKTQRLSLLTFLLVAGSLLASVLVRQNQLWMDEVLSYLLISDPSLAHLNDSMVSGLDANPPVFANLYWLIGHAISLNLVFLKAFSILIFATTLALFYRYTTKLVGKPVTNFVLITGLAAFTYLNITLATQIRAYALLLLVGFVYVTILHRLTRQPTSKSLLIAHTGVGLLLTLTHNFGLFYLAAGGGFWGLLWLWSKDRRYSYGLATFALVGIAWVLLWYPSFAIQAKAGIPHSWIPLPTWQSFFAIVGELAPTVSSKLEQTVGGMPLLAILRFIGLLGLFCFISLPRLSKGFGAAVADPAFMLYLLAGFIYGATIAIALVVSLVHTSVFLSRYLWLNHLLVIYQLIYAFYYLSGSAAFAGIYQRSRAISQVRWLLPAYVLSVAVLLMYQSRKLNLAPTTLLNYVDGLDRKYPVFLESAIHFMPVWFHHSDRPIYFLLDQVSAFDPRNELGSPVCYHILEAVREKYKVSAVMPVDEFKAKRMFRFFVVDERGNYQIERFIRNGSVQVVRAIPTQMDGLTLLECVHTRADYVGMNAPVR